jgi:hypothetical protein
MTGAICACLFVATAATVDAVVSDPATVGLLPLLKDWGPAGLIAFIWLFERRDARKRDATIARRNAQLDEAHKRIVADGREIDVLIEVVQQNTAASTNLANVIGKLAERH